MLKGKPQAHVFQKENFPILNNSVSLSRERPQAKSLGLKKWRSLFFFLIYLFIYLFLAVLGLRFLCEGFL